MIKNLTIPIKILFVVGGILLSYQAQAVYSSSIAGKATMVNEGLVTEIKLGNCVKATTKIGDVITSTAGNVAKVLFISGHSSLCTDPALPFRADIQFTNFLSLTFKVQIPSDYESIKLSELQQFNGDLLTAESKTTDNQGVVIDAIARRPTLSLATLANNLEKIQIAQMQEAVSQNPEELQINGMHAIRFEVIGILRGLIHQAITYQITLLEGEKQFIRVSAYAPTSVYPQQKARMQRIANTISGVEGPSAQMSAPSSSMLNSSPTTRINPKNTQSPAQRLEELKGLLKKGLITQDDYDNKKADILKNL